MKESYKEQPAIDFGHNSYAGSGDAPGVASSFATYFAEATKVKKATGGQILLR
jgi:hypothetical protein